MVGVAYEPQVRNTLRLSLLLHTAALRLSAAKICGTVWSQVHVRDTHPCARLQPVAQEHCLLSEHRTDSPVANAGIMPMQDPWQLPTH